MNTSNLPQPFWAVLLAFFGTVVAVIVLYSPSADNIKLAVLAVASSLVSGALGAFAGHASGVTAGQNATINQVPTPPDPGPAKTETK